MAARDVAVALLGTIYAIEGGKEAARAVPPRPNQMRQPMPDGCGNAAL
jgi:hypothetical protein